jgi:hypothetical protein
LPRADDEQAQRQNANAEAKGERQDDEPSLIGVEIVEPRI